MYIFIRMLIKIHYRISIRNVKSCLFDFLIAYISDKKDKKEK